MMTARSRGRWAAFSLVTVLGILFLAAALPTPAQAVSTASVTYSIEAGAYNNSIRLGPTAILSSPRVVTGPDPANPAQEDVYVLGLNDTGFGPCSNLTVFRSTDGGASFQGLFPSGVCLPGAAVDAVVLANGTIVLAGYGPQVLLSTDGGAQWSSPLILGESTSLPSLSLDPNSSELYLAWTGSSGNSTGPLFVATSLDGGLSWSSPVIATPSGIVAEQAEIAAHASAVALTFLEMFNVPLPNPSPPPSGNNTTTPPPPEAPTQALAAAASSDGGATWGSPSVLEAQNLSLLLGEPSLAVSPTGTFAIAWSQQNNSVAQNGTFVVVSRDGGTSWSSPILASPSGPPSAAPTTFGHTVTFDAYGRLFVTWHNYSAMNPFAAQLNVAISNRSLDTFATSSFALAFRSEVGNGTQSENLAAGASGQVFLTWDVIGPWDNTSFGVFVRTITGEAVGDINGPAGAATVALTDAVTGTTVGQVSWNGRPFTLTALAPDAYQVWVTVGNRSTLAGTIPIVPWGTTSFMVRGVTVGAASVSSFPYAYVILGASSVVAGAVVAVSYTRLTRDTVLRQKLRALIFEYIQSEPGASFSAVRDALGLQNGTASYHLAVLEREGFVQSTVRARRRYYFPLDGAVTSHSPPLSGMQSSILKAVETAPGIGLRELSRAVGREPSTVAYSARVLAREGHLRTVRSGFRLRFYRAAAAGAPG